MPLSRIEDLDEQYINRCFNAGSYIFLMEEVVARYIHKPVDEFHQTNKLKEKKR